MFSTGTKRTVLNGIKRLRLNDDVLASYPAWSHFDKQLVKLCLDYEVITTNELNVAIEQRLLTLGRECYAEHVYSNGSRIFPDHVTSPHSFAYAIQGNVFTEPELKQIDFDHGETFETFLPDQKNTLVEKVYRQIVFDTNDIVPGGVIYDSTRKSPPVST